MTPELIALIHAVWSGVCILIPVPFFDEWAAAYFRRRMVRELALFHKVNLTSAEVGILSEPEATGCMQTVMDLTLGGVFQRILRQLFVVVEVQRAANAVSHVYYQGYLLSQVFARGYVAGGDVEQAEHIQQAVMAAKRSANTQLLAGMVGSAFERSRDSVNAARDRVSALLIGEYRHSTRRVGRWALRKVAASPLPIVPVLARDRLARLSEEEARLDQSVLRAQLTHLPEIETLRQDLWESLLKTPADQSERLLQRLTEELARAGVRPASPPVSEA